MPVLNLFIEFCTIIFDGNQIIIIEDLRKKIYSFSGKAVVVMP
jgi:hypothetical protein